MKSRLPLRVIAWIYALHAGLALALAWPAARLVGVATLALPRGDAVLFDDGGLYLAEVLRLHRGELTSVLEGGSFSLMIAVYLGLLPLGVMLHALARSSRETSRDVETPRDAAIADLVAAAARSFGPFSFLLGMAIAAIACAVGFPQSIAWLLGTKLHDAFGDRGSDLATLGFYVASLALAAVVVVVHDLARAAVVQGEIRGLSAAHLAILAFRARPLGAMGAWAARALSGMLLVAIAAWATSRIGVTDSARLVSVIALHQCVVFALLLLRADWLRRALEIVAGMRTQ